MTCLFLCIFVGWIGRYVETPRPSLCIFFWPIDLLVSARKSYNHCTYLDSGFVSHQPVMTTPNCTQNVILCEYRHYMLKHLLWLQSYLATYLIDQVVSNTVFFVVGLVRGCFPYHFLRYFSNGLHHFSERRLDAVKPWNHIRHCRFSVFSTTFVASWWWRNCWLLEEVWKFGFSLKWSKRKVVHERDVQPIFGSCEGTFHSVACNFFWKIQSSHLLI